jgi:dihydrofolate reductase
MSFVAIAAMANHRVIGLDNTIPWHIPEDFKWFKKKTMGHDLIMGRKTFESIGKALPGRNTIVLSRTGFSHPDIETYESINDLPPTRGNGIRFICGGGEMYKEFLPRCTDLFLTIINRAVNGNRYFPVFENEFTHVETLHQGDKFTIEHYVNNRNDESHTLV